MVYSLMSKCYDHHTKYSLERGGGRPRDNILFTSDGKSTRDNHLQAKKVS